jgi:integrase/recombinase XerC
MSEIKKSTPSSAMVLASKWNSPENRRREGMRAAHGQNEAALCELLESYLLLKSSRKGLISPKTLLTYTETVHKFLGYTGPPESPKLGLLQLTPDDLELWMLHLQREEGLSPSSIKRHVYGLRNLFKALIWAEVLKTDPSATVRPPSDKTESHVKKGALPLDMYRKLLTLPLELHPDDLPRARRDVLLLLLGGSSGLRAAEICGLEVGDVDLKLRRLKVRGKGAKTRVVPLQKSMLEALQAWLESRKALELRGKIQSQALLVSFQPMHFGKKLSTNGARTIAASYYTPLGIPLEMFGLHTLRRTAGTHLYRATRDLHVVADILGHSSVNTSAIYAKMDSDVRLEALDKLERLQNGD